MRPKAICNGLICVDHMKRIRSLDRTVHFQFGQSHPTLKESVISPLLKKPTLDKEELSNYRPNSNLTIISKIIERVVNPVSWITSVPTIYSILTSQPTANITPLKQLFCTSTITSSVQWDHRKYHASAYSTSLLLSILLTMTS